MEVFQIEIKRKFKSHLIYFLALAKIIKS